MNVLSLCDGMSCGQIALKELGIKVHKYYASEIDTNAIKVTQSNFPDTIQLGDVTKISLKTLESLPKIDLLMFGSPCKSLSITTAGREKYNSGLKGASNIFYPCYNILNWIQKYNNPDVRFLIENVNSNKKSDIEIMSTLIGVKPILINSELFSAQSRERFYWINIPVDSLDSIESNKQVIKDILDDEYEVDKKYYMNHLIDFYGQDKKVVCKLHIKGHDIMKRVYNINYKCPTLTACRGGNHQKKVYVNGKIRKLTPHEYMKLQTIPDWYVMNVSDTHIYNMCGDGWNIETIKFLLRNINKYTK